MADINYVVGTNGDDVLTPTDGMNDYLGMGGNDAIDGSTGVNTIHYNYGDGVDTVKFALPRSYQFGDFLTAAQNGLDELASFADGAGPYSNSYFASADSSLIGLLPADLASSIGALQSTFIPGVGYVPGSLDAAAAEAAFTSLINWINTSTSNVIQFGPGITLGSLNLQLGAMVDLGTPQSTPVEFAVAVGSEQGVVFNLSGPPVVAGDSSSPPVIDLTFQFADGTSATLADLMARPDPGVMGTQYGSDDSDLLSGSLGSDMIFGFDGDDRIDGGAGDDYLFGGSGDDVINGGSGYDNAYGEDGNDIMAAGKGGNPLTGAPPDFLSGGSGNDVYTFNRGDGGEPGVTIDNADPDGSGIDTISFGKDVSPADLVASVDPSSGNLVLGISGTTDHLTITWFDAGSGMAPRADQVIDRVQFIDADGTAHVYDLASLVQAAFPNPSAANPSDSVQLVDANAVELPVEAAGGEAAVRYALTGSLLAGSANQAPAAAAVADQTVLQDDPNFSFTLPAGTFSDPEGAALTLNATTATGQALPSWLSFDAVHGTFSGTPTNDDVGHVAVKVTATDPGGLSASQTFNLEVQNVNDAPTASAGVAVATATEDASFTYNLPAGTFADVDAGDVLTYGAKMADGSALPSWLQVDAVSGTLRGTPVNGDVGNLSVVVTATDRANVSASKAVSIGVVNTNDAPTTAHAVADQSAVAGSPFSMVVPSNTFQDVDAGDALTLSARLANGDPLPSWLHFDAVNRTLSGTAGASGQWNIALVATDLAGTSVSDAFTLNVDAPPASTGKIINGTSGNDKLYGTAGNDQINGGKGKDLLSGGGGDDTLLVSADAKWGSGSTRTNTVTGEKVSIKGKVRSYDVFDGGTGSDTLIGTSGGDAILLDDSKSSAPQKGARIVGVENINAGAGDDVVDLTSKRYSYGNVAIDGGSGNDVLWSSSGKDVLRGGAGNDSLDGGVGNDYLEGGSGNDKLNGGSGVDVLQGGSGKDTLKDTSGNGVLDGGSNNDSLTEGSGNSMLIGGQGSDHLSLGGGYDVIAFNRGDGRDVVSSGKSGNSTLSLGGGISYQDLTLSRSGSDLILNIGSSDRITFEKWYDGRKYQAVSKLQVVAEAMPGFDAAGGDALHDDKIETFDFKGLVKAFDTARSHSPGLSKWTLTNALAQFHLGGSDTAALGGDLAYQYGVNGTLVGIAANVAQDTAGSSQFGKQAQSLHSLTELKDGLVKLS